MFPLTRPTLFRTPVSAIFLSVKMQKCKIKKVKHRPQQNTCIFIKLKAPTLFFSWKKVEKGRKKKKKKKKEKKFFLITDQIFFSMLVETQLFCYVLRHSLSTYFSNNITPHLDPRCHDASHIHVTAIIIKLEYSILHRHF